MNGVGRVTRLENVLEVEIFLKAIASSCGIYMFFFRVLYRTMFVPVKIHVQRAHAETLSTIMNALVISAIMEGIATKRHVFPFLVFFTLLRYFRISVSRLLVLLAVHV